MINENAPVQTRQSLLSRLKDCSDHESWKTFFDTYWKLIYTMAVRAGLTDAEAQDVVQETVISVAKSMPTFVYDVAQGSFKTWLLQLTSWRITDQLRKRAPEDARSQGPARGPNETATIERVADPAGVALEAAWNEEWETNLIDAAVQRVKGRVEAKMFQIFDLHVLKQWSVARVARGLKVNRAYVYLSKHRVSKLIKKEIEYLKTKPL